MAGRKRKAPSQQDNVSKDNNNNININGKSQPSTDAPSSPPSSSNQKKRKLQTVSSTQSSSINPTILISKVDHDATLALLKTMDWQMAKNTSRRNVIRSDDPSTPRNKTNKPYCMSFIFGRNMKDPTGGLSWWSTKYPEVYAELRALMSKYDATFAYTHITLNRNLRCKRHTDGGNAGPSYIAAFGKFKGGGLIVEQPGGGMPETVLDLQSKFVKFNGKTQPHETLAFTGERFTLVYYTSDIAPEEGAVDRRRVGASAATAAGVSSSLAAKFQEIKAKLGNRRKK